LSPEKKLRFRIRRGDYEVELEGDFDYVREQFEELQGSLHPSVRTGPSDQTTIPSSPHPDLRSPIAGVVEFTPEGRPHLTVPVDDLSAKEAISLVMYSLHPKPLGDDDLSSLLSSSWKATGESVVRARVSELRKEGKLIAERGSYVLSGAGVQWLQNDVLPRLQKGASSSPATLFAQSPAL
jgi:hypothetical protein